MVFRQNNRRALLKRGSKRLLTTGRLLSVGLLLWLTLLYSCSSIDCPVQNTVSAVYHLYNAKGERVTLIDTLDIVTVRRDGTDTLLLNKAVDISSFSLPMGYSNAEDTLVLRLTNLQIEDTVWIQKKNTLHFESVDCSASYFHTITAVRSTHHFIDSLVVKNPSVNYDPTNEHFHLRLLSDD